MVQRGELSYDIVYSRTIPTQVIDLVNATADILRPGYGYRSIKVNVFERLSKVPIERTRINYTITLRGNLDVYGELRGACNDILQPFFPLATSEIPNSTEYSRDAIITKIRESLTPTSPLAIFGQSGVTRFVTRGQSITFQVFDRENRPSSDVSLTLNVQADGFQTFEETVPFPHNVGVIDVYLNDAASEYRKSSKRQILLH